MKENEDIKQISENKITLTSEERRAIEYFENLLDKWVSWKVHHKTLIKNLEIILSIINRSTYD